MTQNLNKLQVTENFLNNFVYFNFFLHQWGNLYIVNYSHILPFVEDTSLKIWFEFYETNNLFMGNAGEC